MGCQKMGRSMGYWRWAGPGGQGGGRLERQRQGMLGSGNKGDGHGGKLMAGEVQMEMERGRCGAGEGWGALFCGGG